MTYIPAVHWVMGKTPFPACGVFRKQRRATTPETSAVTCKACRKLIEHARIRATSGGRI